LPKERVEEIRMQLLAIVRTFLTRILYAPYADSEEDTKMLIEGVLIPVRLVTIT